LPTAAAIAAAPQPPLLSAATAPSALHRIARTVRAARARQSFPAFFEFTQKDEATGQPVRLSAMHREWARLLALDDRLQILAHVESGKSNLVSVAWVLFQLGRNPNLRVCLISNTAAQGEKLLRAVARQIERNAELHAVFPHLRASTPWNVNSITVERGVVSKDPSVFACGINGALLGARVDLLILDDPTDFEAARTEEGRAKAFEWVVSTAFSRLTSRSQVVVVATPWHREDLHARLEAQGWHTVRFPVERDDGAPSWPERWTPERIAKKRMELGPAQSARQLDVVCRADEASTFDTAWLEIALRRGENESLRLSRNDRGEPYWLTRPRWPARILCGLDPSVGRTNRSDLSALVTVYLREDGSREVLEVSAGRWSGPEILQRVDSVNERFAPARIVVESNGSQEFLMHFAKQRGTRLPLEAFATGRGEKSLQWLAERLGAEMAAGRWILPSVGRVPVTPELRALVRDLLAYTPRDHVPDRVAALLLATTAIASSSVRVESLARVDLLAR
jgi:hypothetical protein